MTASPSDCGPTTSRLVLAEKVETILRRTVFNTRPRVFYDTYILATTQRYDMELFRQAMTATARHRGTADQIVDVDSILADIAESTALRSMWENYRRQFAYAKEAGTWPNNGAGL